MRNRLLAMTIALAGLLAPVGLVHALRIAPPPGPVRIVNSDAVFVGKVIEFEPIDVDAKPFPQAKETVKYRIGVVKVNQVIRGLKVEKTMRIGFIPVVPPKPGEPRIGGRRGGPQLEVGQEGLFMVSKHADGKFYLAPDYGYFVPLAQQDFASEVATAKKVVAIMADPMAILESKDADERLLAASILVSKYRTQKAPFPNKEEPIGAAESRLILNVIANAKWEQVDFRKANPQQLFFQLGINEKDGWKTPMNIKSANDLRDAVQAWVRAHGEYRIKRFVSGVEK